MPETVVSLWSGFCRNLVLPLVFAVLSAAPLIDNYHSFHDAHR